MKHRISRRTAIKQLAQAGLGIGLVACRPTAGPTQTPAPTPTATPLPVDTPAHETAAAYLSAWAANDLQAMYNLCSSETRQTTSFVEFQRIYAEIANEATLIAVRPLLTAVLQEGRQARAAFQVEFQTSFVGNFQASNELPLVWDGDRWAVAWSKQCIFRELTPQNLVHMISKSAVRANIYDVNGKGLAVKKDLVTVGVIPRDIKDEAALLSRLNVVLKIPQSEIKAKYESQPPTWFIPIADISLEASQQQYQFLLEPGISLREKSVRAYRDPVAAPHIIGFLGGIPAETLATWQARGYTGDELIGRVGIEAWGESYLAGKRGGTLTVITPEGQVAATLAKRDAVPARSIYLTVDYNYQRKVEDLLGERKGSVAVMNVNDGRVLALATWPRFDSNHFAEGINAQVWDELNGNPDKPLLNRPLQGSYPSGSTFKMISMGTLMERGGVLPTKVFNCPGSWNKLGWAMTCWLKSGHGDITLQDALTASCDVTFYQVGYDLSFVDIDALPSYAKSFGMGAVTGIGKPLEGSDLATEGQIDPLGEVSGLVPDDTWKRRVYGEGWSVGDTVNLAIGQGFFLATPLQMCRMVAAIANGGTLYRPQIVEKVAAVGEQPEIAYKPERVGRLPLTADTLKAIQQGMIGVTTKSFGTAPHRFVDFPYTVAGKTGTAQNEGELPHSWFVGYLPAEKPEIAIVAMIENIGEGTTYAAPLFRKVAAAYYGVEEEAPEVEGQGD
ncbi:MAG: penicillin-binding protein 2 [Anaerolineae bacterium]|nr:penicillin-binding protein 2 [Anaerolineae bacterium]